MYGSWDIRCEGQNLLPFWNIFLLFYTNGEPENQNFQKMNKTPRHIIILHKCSKNHDHMLYCSWDMVHDRYNCYCLFGAFFCPFTPLTTQKISIWKNKKNTGRYHLTHVYQKLSSYDVWFLRYGAQWTDGRTDGRMEKVT